MTTHHHLLLESIEVVIPHTKYPFTEVSTMRDVTILQLFPQHQKNCPQSRTLNDIYTLYIQVINY